MQPGLANSRFRTGSATRVPADGDFRAPAMRSTGFKTDLIPQPAWVPPPNPRGLLARKELSPVLGRPSREAWVYGKGVTVDWRNPSDKFFFFSSPDAERASFLAAEGMDGQPQIAEPWEGSGCSSLRSQARKKRKEKKNVKKKITKGRGRRKK